MRRWNMYIIMVGLIQKMNILILQEMVLVFMKKMKVELVLNRL